MLALTRDRLEMEGKNQARAQISLFLARHTASMGGYLGYANHINTHFPIGFSLIFFFLLNARFIAFFLSRLRADFYRAHFFDF